MAQWHCVINGQQYGPVDEGVLRQWIAEKRVLGDNLVWTEGMSDWVRADSVADLAGPVRVGPPPVPGAILLSPAVDGTGGNRANREITHDAHERLRGQWGLPIAFCLLLGLLQSGGGVPFIGPLASLILGGPFMLGGATFFLTFARGGKVDMGMLFAGFKNFGNALGLYMLQAIFVMLWSLLLIVPGIIAALAYSQSFYLLAEDKTLGPMEALHKSKALMKGHKWKLFCLGLRFFGWALLCMLTLGIGFLWLMPYMATSYARFHDDLRRPGVGAGDAPADDSPATYQWAGGQQPAN